MIKIYSLKRYFYNVLFLFSVIFIFTLIEYMIFVYSIGGYGPNLIATITKCIGDLAIILCIYWILPYKKLWIVLIIQSVLSIFFIANIWYYRFFNELLSPLSYRLASNLNSTLFTSISNVLRFEDLIYLIFPILLIVIFQYINKKISIKYNLTKRNRMFAILISIFLWAIGQCAFIITERKQDYSVWGYTRESLSDNIKCRLSFNIKDRSPQLGELRLEGLALYFGRSFVMVWNDIISNGGRIKLNDIDTKNIDEYISSIKIQKIQNLDTLSTSKNIILILVESLNSYVINKSINGFYLTPVMNNLIKTQGTLSSLNVRTQVKEGISNDGQLIINTGLLPIEDGVVMMNFGSSNSFPTLINAFPNHDNLVIFGDNGQTWNQTESFKSFGFNKIYSELNFKEEAELIGNDGAMFKLCRQLIPALKTPFFIELVTFSTHVPFMDKGVMMPSWISKIQNIEEHVKNYYSMINYFDNELGKFIQFLQKKNLWYNTLLIITSDHSILHALSHENQKNYKQLSDIPAVFIAANSGITKQVDHPVGQVNIFPTILQLMNSSGINGYTGLGKSILDNSLTSAVDSEGKIWGHADSIEIARQKQAFEISELIHRGNYFGNTKK